MIRTAMPLSVIVAMAVHATAARDIVIAVPGIPGPYCAYGAEKRLREVPGVADVAISWPDQQIRVVTRPGSHVTADDISRAMTRADYPYKYEIRMGDPR